MIWPHVTGERRQFPPEKPSRITGCSAPVPRCWFEQMRETIDSVITNVIQDIQQDLIFWVHWETSQKLRSRMHQIGANYGCSRRRSSCLWVTILGLLWDEGKSTWSANMHSQDTELLYPSDLYVQISWKDMGGCWIWKMWQSLGILSFLSPLQVLSLSL